VTGIRRAPPFLLTLDGLEPPTHAADCLARGGWGLEEDILPEDTIDVVILPGCRIDLDPVFT